MSKASTHLASVCPRMKALIRRIGPPRLEMDAHSPYEALVRAIAHQQLHGAAAWYCWRAVDEAKTAKAR